MEKRLEITSLEDLRATVGEIIDFANGSNIWLFLGEMGAGKTTTIQAICERIGVLDSVHSPTFSIVNEYLTEDDKTVYHFDFYRIENVEEVFSIGIEEYFDSGNLCLLEWPQNIESVLPDTFVRIDITENPDRTRTIKLSKHG